MKIKGGVGRVELRVAGRTDPILYEILGHGQASRCYSNNNKEVT